jgi:ribosomal protein S18 acetylase RimI-like enzyme
MAPRRSPRETTAATEVAPEPVVAPRRTGRGGQATAKAPKAPRTVNAPRTAKPAKPPKNDRPPQPLITVRHMSRRDINRVWDFLKVSFREVNAETVEYQRPRSKLRFEEVYEEEGIEQLLFEVEGTIVAYAECSYEVIGSDNWINPRYFEKRDMRPLFVDELAVHPEMHGRGVGSFVLEQLHHLARVHGLNHLVLEVAENNERALDWYKKRSFKKLDAAIFMACTVVTEPELLPPRALPPARDQAARPDKRDEPDPGE